MGRVTESFLPQLCLHSSNTSSWHVAYLRHRGNFTFTSNLLTCCTCMPIINLQTSTPQTEFGETRYEENVIGDIFILLLLSSSSSSSSLSSSSSSSSSSFEVVSFYNTNMIAVRMWDRNKTSPIPCALLKILHGDRLLLKSNSGTLLRRRSRKKLQCDEDNCGIIVPLHLFPLFWIMPTLFMEFYIFIMTFYKHL
jgi:hypothetical protein